jgi:hypothetical protein
MINKLKFLYEGISFYDKHTKNIIKVIINERYFKFTINDKTYYFTLKDDGRCFFDGTDYYLIPEDISQYPTLNDLSVANTKNDGKPDYSVAQHQDILEDLKNKLMESEEKIDN